MKLRWEDVEDIAEGLLLVYPDTDPLGVRFTDLHGWVTALEGFADDPQASSEGFLLGHHRTHVHCMYRRKRGPTYDDHQDSPGVVFSIAQDCARRADELRRR